MERQFCVLFKIMGITVTENCVCFFNLHINAIINSHIYVSKSWISHPNPNTMRKDSKSIYTRRKHMSRICLVGKWHVSQSLATCGNTVLLYLVATLYIKPGYSLLYILDSMRIRFLSTNRMLRSQREWSATRENENCVSNENPLRELIGFPSPSPLHMCVLTARDHVRMLALFAVKLK